MDIIAFVKNVEIKNKEEFYKCIIAKNVVKLWDQISFILQII